MEYFQGLTDPRLGRAKRHNLLDSAVLTICAALCGSDNRVGLAAAKKSTPAAFPLPAYPLSAVRPPRRETAPL